MKKQQLLLMLAMSAYSFNVDAQQWAPVGSTTVTPESISSLSMKLKNDLPYVAVGDGYLGTETNLLAYDGANWDTVGTATLTTGDETGQFLAFDNSGVPHIAYIAADDSYKIKVIKSDAANNWTTVGALNSEPNAAQPFLVFSNTSSNLYLSYSYVFGNPIPGLFVNVEKFDNSWNNIITNNTEATNPSIAYFGNRLYLSNQVDIQGIGVPADLSIISYSAQGNSPTVVVSENNVDQPVMAVDGNDLYVAFKDQSNSGKATVIKQSGSTLTTVGMAGFTTNALSGIANFDLAVYNNQPYLAFKDAANGDKATLMRFNGSSWVTVGTAGFSVGDIDDVNLEISSTGTAYVAYKDNGNAGKLAVMKYDLTVSVDKVEAINQAINLYPNPVTNVVTVDTELNVNQINVLSIDGKLLKSATTKTISVEDLAQGVYTLEILTSEGKGFKKFVKK